MAELFKSRVKLILQRPGELNAAQCEKKHAKTHRTNKSAIAYTVNIVIGLTACALKPATCQ